MTKNLPAIIPSPGQPAPKQSTAVAVSGGTQAPPATLDAPPPYRSKQPEPEKLKGYKFAEEKPKKAPTEDYLTLEQARRLINRVRRTNFYLYVRSSVYPSDDIGRYYPRSLYLHVSAKQLFEVIDQLQRNPNDAARLVYCHHTPVEEKYGMAQYGSIFFGV